MNNPLQKLSARERVLLGATVALLVTGLVFFAGRSALATVKELDTQMEQLEFTLLGLRQMEARGRSIDEAFAQVAALHSSAWTEQEIHDRLRLEIYRLAMLTPPPEDKPELVIVTGGQKLVNIPSLRQGSLFANSDGYREYQLRIVLPNPTPVDHMIEFLRRLQESRHSLRIDAVELVRPADGTQVTARIDITRTVVHDAPVEAAGRPDALARSLLTNPGFEFWNADGTAPQAWQTHGLRVEPVEDGATEGAWALRGEGTEAGGYIYQEVDLVAGQRYMLAMDIAVNGAARLTFATADGDELPGGQALDADGATHHYTASIVAPGSPGEVVRLRAPVIVVTDAGTTVLLDNAMLREGDE
jgi:hypothetical protein